jgi:hypothetical protein
MWLEKGVDRKCYGYHTVLKICEEKCIDPHVFSEKQ